MAIQGKGIFGGFSGKIGKVVGYHRNGQDIIQSNNTKQRRKFGYNWDMIDQLLVDPRDVEVGNYFVLNRVTDVAFRKGARSEKEILSGNCMLEFALSDGISYGCISFGDTLNDYSYVRQEFTIMVSALFIRVFERGQLKFTGFTAILGAKFRILIKNGVATYLYSAGNNNYTVFYTSDRVVVYPLSIVASMQTKSSLFTGLKMGGENVSV